MADQLLCNAPPPCAVQAASLGVPRGPLFGKLVKGEEVTAANGQVVRPADVMEPATPGEAAQHPPCARQPMCCLACKSSPQGSRQLDAGCPPPPPG